MTLANVHKPKPYKILCIPRGTQGDSGREGRPKRTGLTLLPGKLQLHTTAAQRQQACDQGSTGVLKTSDVPTWTVNFGVGCAHPAILLDAVLHGHPTQQNFSVRASDFVLTCSC